MEPSTVVVPRPSVPVSGAHAGATEKLPLERFSRDRRIDFFRGVALLGIAVNHTVPPPAIYRTHGHYQFGHFFSFGFADLFIFLSGLVCAMAYSRVLQEKGFWAGQKKAIHRCMQIYIANVLAFVAVACMMLTVHAFVSTNVIFLNFDTTRLTKIQTWQGLLWMSPGYNHFNILKFYVVLLMLMPLGLALYRWRRWALLLPSLAAYGYIQAAQRLDLPLREATSGAFGNYLAWQLLFFIGVAIGSEIKRGKFGFELSTTMLAALVLFLVGCDYFRQTRFAVHHFSDKTFMGPLRIVELLVVVALVARIMPRDAQWMRQGVTGWITRLGSRSLEIFALTLVSCYAFTHLAALMGVGRAGYALILLAEVGFVLLAGRGILLLIDRQRPSGHSPREGELPFAAAHPRKAA